ncbi:MAG TPA: adaptor protein MecA [Lachnospiraceae bacterium]|nr:adaptor protein MecA [Lachnospiraceae bacterium]
MKIEKVNDNQIRCTLTREDLDQRQLKISEIAYGSEKAKSLFKDMMQQANYEYGFEAEDIPLMIEAIPMNTGCVVFIITKVDDPEELDTRFSKFAPSIHEDDVYEDDAFVSDTIDEVMENMPENASDVYDLFRKITGRKPALPEESVKSGTSTDKPAVYGNRIFSFDNLSDLTSVAGILKGYTSGDSILYKNTRNGKYYLLLCQEYYNQKDYVHVCNILMEYGTPEVSTASIEAYMEEHYDTIIGYDALQSLAQI